MRIAKIIIPILICLYPLATFADEVEPVESDSVPVSGVVVEEFDIEAVSQAVNRPIELPSIDFGELVTVTRPASWTPALADVPVTAFDKRNRARGTQQSIYDMPLSLDGTCYDWRRLWINTGVLTGAFVGTLFVLELLPEDATSWNRAALQDIPLFTRWKQHVIDEGPEWDHDKFYFNYLLHPYAGAAYFMGARSVGFNFYQSLLYSTLVSTIGWEFGVEAFMERPSYQDLFITPIIGSFFGEFFYRAKRSIVDNDYRIWGSPVLGHIVAFLIDPLNEFVGLFDHNPALRVAHERAASRAARPQFALVPSPTSISLRITF